MQKQKEIYEQQRDSGSLNCSQTDDQSQTDEFIYIPEHSLLRQLQTHLSNFLFIYSTDPSLMSRFFNLFCHISLHLKKFDYNSCMTANQIMKSVILTDSFIKLFKKEGKMMVTNCSLLDPREDQ
jgi:hypothetical protein